LGGQFHRFFHYKVGGAIRVLSLPDLELIEELNLNTEARALVLSDDFYLMENNNSIYSVDTKTGQTIWVKDVASSVYFLPIIEDDTIYITDCHNLYIISKSSGNEINTVEIANYQTEGNIVPVFSHISPPSSNNKYVFVVHDGTLFSVRK